MSKRVALNKRDREKMKKKLLAHRAELVADLDGTDAEIDQLQDPSADDLDRAVEAGTMELLVALGDTERRELEEIMLAAPDLKPYLDLVRQVFADFAIPLRIVDAPIDSTPETRPSRWLCLCQLEACASSTRTVK